MYARGGRIKFKTGESGFEACQRESIAMIDKLFREHPRSVGESYGQHRAVAWHFGISMLLAGLALLVHALIPALFPDTGSRTIEHLHQKLQERNRDRKKALY